MHTLLARTKLLNMKELYMAINTRGILEGKEYLDAFSLTGYFFINHFICMLLIITLCIDDHFNCFKDEEDEVSRLK